MNTSQISAFLRILLSHFLISQHFSTFRISLQILLIHKFTKFIDY